MQIFLDSADIELIKEFHSIGIIDGITTNPSIIAKSGRPYFKTIEQICDLISGPVSAEVIATDYENMVKEALRLADISEYVVIKLPITADGLRACKYLSMLGYKTNMTLCFTVTQAMLAAKAGATYISPFVGRLDDIGQSGMGLIEDICTIFSNYSQFESKVLVASIRNINHIVESALIGADVVTIPPSLVSEMFKHHLTDIGLEKFLSDWNKSGQVL